MVRSSKDPENNFFIPATDGTPHCELRYTAFSISSNKLKVISNNKIVTGPAYLTIEQVPPLFIPFGFFPNKKVAAPVSFFQASANPPNAGSSSSIWDITLASTTISIGPDHRPVHQRAATRSTGFHNTGSVIVMVAPFELSYAYSVQSEKELPDFQRQEGFSDHLEPQSGPQSQSLQHFQRQRTRRLLGLLSKHDRQYE